MDGEGPCSTDLGTENPARNYLSRRSQGMNSFPRRSVMIWVVAALMVCTPRLTASDPWMSLGKFFHPIQTPDCLPAPACAVDQTSSCCNSHVYIFAVNGWDSLCLGNFNGLCDYLREQGFANTYFGQLYTCAHFSSRIRQIRQEDPEARIVLIGFSCGCNVAKGIANSLNKDGTRIDLLVYLAGDYITNSPSSYPGNVGNVLNIRGKGYFLSGGSLFFCGADIDGARNCTLDTRHMLAPSRRETLELLMEELLPLTCPPKSATQAKTGAAVAQSAGQPVTQTVHKVETVAALAQSPYHPMTPAVHKVATIAALAGQPMTNTIPKVETSVALTKAASQPVTHTVQKVEITDHAEQAPASALRIP
jgi:hypothetical protein